MPIATRLTNSGTLLVNGSFDENTSIAPAEFRTTSTAVYAATIDEVTLDAGSISFDGSTQYLTVPTSSFLSATNTYTIEFWMYPIAYPGGTNTASLYQITNTNVANFGGLFVELYASGNIRFEVRPSTGGTNVVITSSSTVSLNTWTHVAVSVNAGSAVIYINGVSVGTGTVATMDDTQSFCSIGYLNNGYTTSQSYYNGYISNLRIVRAVAVYTAAFTPSQSVLPAIDGTSLLLNVIDSTNFITDGSSNNLTLTNNGTATWNTSSPFNANSAVSRQISDGTLQVTNSFDEFTGAPVVDSSLLLWLDSGQTSSYSGSGTTWTDLSGQANTGTLNNSPTFTRAVGGGTFLFNGTNQTASVASLNLQQNFTLEAWVNQNVLNGFAIFGQGTSGVNNGGLHIVYNSNTTIRFGFYFNDTDFTVATSTGTWYHMIFTYNSSTFAKGFYLNAVVQSGTTISGPAAYTGSGTFRLGASYSTGGVYGNGYFEGVKMYNRILTADEITTNFNALRGRFGI